MIKIISDKLITDFCYLYDIDETEFCKDVAEISAKIDVQTYQLDQNTKIEAVWNAIAARNKGYEFAIMAGTEMANAPSVPLNFLKNYAPDLRSVFHRTPYFISFLNATDIKCHETADTVSLYIKSQQPGYGSSNQIASYFAFLVKMARSQTTKPFHVKKLELNRKHKTCLRLKEFMGCDIEQASTNSLQVHKSEAMKPFIGADKVMWIEAESELKRRLFGDKKSALHKDVHNIFKETLPDGNGTVDTVIDRMGISKRTLQRRLKKDGISFRKILNETRFRLASELLKQGDISKTEIAYRLGYRDPNSFYRVYKEWKLARSADN